MRVVVASRLDHAATEIVEAWGADARLLTCDDLATPGWIHRPGDPGRSRAVLSGSAVAYTQLTGVWPLALTVSPVELTGIVPEDRVYVAAEMTAFLRAFLADIPGRVVNRALSPWTAAWAPERWRWEARRRGHRVIDEDDLSGEGMEAVSLVGERIIGPARLGPVVRDLARGLHLDLLTGYFRNGRFAVASTRPPVDRQQVVETIGRYLAAEP